MSNGMHNCDHNATSPLRPECLPAITHALSVGGNPSSVHAAGRAARAMVEEAREEIAALAGMTVGDIIFTSGSTEANNLALAGAVEGAVLAEQRITRLFVSAIEHSSILVAAARLAERTAGLKLSTIPVTPDGVVDTEALRVMLREGKGRTLVAVMAANNETGAIQPIAEISRLVREAKALLLVDAVTAAGKIDLDATLCDYMTLSAHKIGGPQGVGALVVADGAPLVAQLLGGGQQKGLRAGTENLSGIAGFGTAAHALRDAEGERARIRHIRDRFERELRNAIPDTVVFATAVPRLAGTSNIALPGLAADSAVIALDLDGVLVSSGSSCSSGKIAPSQVLAAMGVEPSLAGGAIRVSFGWSSTPEDADAAVASLVKLWQRVHSASRAA
jgi:cysteine desulfurase